MKTTCGVILLGLAVAVLLLPETGGCDAPADLDDQETPVPGHPGMTRIGRHHPDYIILWEDMALPAPPGTQTMVAWMNQYVDLGMVEGRVGDPPLGKKGRAWAMEVGKPHRPGEFCRAFLSFSRPSRIYLVEKAWGRPRQIPYTEPEFEKCPVEWAYLLKDAMGGTDTLQDRYLLFDVSAEEIADWRAGTGKYERHLHTHDARGFPLKSPPPAPPPQGQNPDPLSLGPPIREAERPADPLSEQWYGRSYGYGCSWEPASCPWCSAPQHEGREVYGAKVLRRYECGTRLTTRYLNEYGDGPPWLMEYKWNRSDKCRVREQKETAPPPNEKSTP